jgi:hypothetical protein
VSFARNSEGFPTEAVVHWSWLSASSFTILSIAQDNYNINENYYNATDSAGAPALLYDDRYRGCNDCANDVVSPHPPLLFALPC